MRRYRQAAIRLGPEAEGWIHTRICAMDSGICLDGTTYRMECRTDDPEDPPNEITKSATQKP